MSFTMVKKVLCIILALSFALALCSCTTDGDKTSQGSSTGGQSSAAAQQGDPDMITGTIYGVITASDIKQNDFGYEDGKCDPEKIAAALSEWTGLNFAISFKVNDDGAYVIDWKSDSTLATGSPPEPQKEEFHFFDADSLRWFMLNSLCYTVRRNLGDADVYYSADGIDLNTLELDYDFNPVFAYNSIEDERVIA